MLWLLLPPTPTPARAQRLGDWLDLGIGFGVVVHRQPSPSANCAPIVQSVGATLVHRTAVNRVCLYSQILQ